MSAGFPGFNVILANARQESCRSIYLVCYILIYHMSYNPTD